MTVRVPEFVDIPAGRAVIGPGPEDGARDADEGTARWCVFSAFRLSRAPVTFAEWDAYREDAGVAYRPSDMGWGRGERPVVNISHRDTAGYLAWLSSRLGTRCGLPDEDAWEYAARAGTRSVYWWGDEADPTRANFSRKRSSEDGRKQERQTLTVGTFPGNPWGLWDMSGNIWEWCVNCWRDRSIPDAPWRADRFVLRGGAYDSDPHMLRCSYRTHLPGWARYSNVGFRVLAERYPE